MHTKTLIARLLKRSLAGIGVAAVLAALLPQTALAVSSWNPTLLVNTESFEEIDDGDGTTDIELRFGASSQTIKFLTTSKFRFSHSISVLGTISGSTLNIDRNATVRTLTVTGAITGISTITAKTILSGNTLRVSSGGADVQGALNASGAIRTDSDLTLNADDGANDVTMTFMNSGTDETLTWLETADKFQFSDDVSVVGHISGSTLRVDGITEIHGALFVTGSILSDANLTLNGDDGATDVTMTFMNSGTDETLTWLETADKFQFSDDVSVVGHISGSTLRIDGGAEVHGPLAVTGAIRTDSNLTINDDQTAADAVMTFGQPTTNQTLTYFNTAGKFQFSKTLSVLGTISGSALNVDGNATVGGTLTASGNIRTKANISGTTLTIDGNVTLHSETYSFPVSQGAGQLTNDGAGNLTWTAGSVGNGSGDILSLHPEYPNAIFYSSGTAIIGQLTMSGGTNAFDNSYQWTSSKPTIQDYWISVRQRLPDNFSSWDSVKPMEFRYKTGLAALANNHLTLRIRDTAGALFTLTGSLAATSWTTAIIGSDDTTAFTGGTWTPKGYFTVYLKTAANNTASAAANASFMNFNFETTTP